MPSRNAQIAEAVKTGLNTAAAASAFSASFVALRKYVPASRLEDLKNLTVTVYSSDDQTERITRVHDQHQVTVEVGIQQRLASGLDPASSTAAVLATINAEIDAFMLLCEGVLAWFKPRCIDVAGAEYSKANFLTPMIDPVHLMEKRVMTNVIAATFLFTVANP